MPTDTAPPAHPCEAGDLRITASADGHSAARLGQRVRDWLAGAVHIDEQRCADVVLATYEALANCADHAYRGHSRPGQMTLHLRYDDETSTVQICVEDHGRWIDPDTQPSSRGRGLLLMRALADDVSVDGRRDGTTICLHFQQCPRYAAMAGG